MALFEVKNVNITYHNQDSTVMACRNVSLSVDEEESVGIVGESGSGKSTLAMGVIRLLPAYKTVIDGEALFEGKDLLKMSNEELGKYRWKEVSVIFQKSMNSLSPVHRIGKQMEDIYKVHYPNEDPKVIKERIIELLKIVNLTERVYMSYPHDLSGGMMQRVSIALALIFSPKLLIMDEATTALDVVTQSQILGEIMELEKKLKIARIMITHDVSVVASTCKRIVVMYAGEIMEQGEVKDVLVNPKHPYTQGLLNSFPSFKGERGTLTGIPGSLPDLTKEIPGCAFADRCPFATERCHKEKPGDYEVSPRWVVRCFKEEVKNNG